MPIRHGLLALLERGPMYGYQLRTEFEVSTGATWPLNIGQVYTTIQRLERDGLVERADDADSGGDVERFALTDPGRAAAQGWWLSPVRRGAPERDELVIKLALAVGAPGVDIRAVVQAQRSETMRALRDFTRLKAAEPDGGTHPGGDLAWSLVLDHHVFAAEAEMRWLDHVEARASRAAAAATRSAVSAADATARSRR
jgi:DNA-binding PadR family transcriptional regulator